jgi:pimeloyl-ACP methyl ester carboxylesterase
VRVLKPTVRAALVVAAAGAAWIGWQQLPAFGAGALLHPGKRPLTAAPPPGCGERAFEGDGVTLRGWDCRSANPHATIVFLHGSADNRQSAVGVVPRFLPRGYRVIAYDSRAHGASGGDACTYGYYEKGDLRRVLDALPSGPVVLIGTSLGAAVALQEAADDPRIRTVVAAETFSDLRTVATERAPRFFTRGTIDSAFALAEREARFTVDEVSPVRAATHIRVPVLLIHGDADADTPPAHSERIRAALKSPSRLILVPGAHHNESLQGAEVWRQIEQWIDETMALLPRTGSD